MYISKITCFDVKCTCFNFPTKKLPQNIVSDRVSVLIYKALYFHEKRNKDLENVCYGKPACVLKTLLRKVKHLITIQN